MTIIVRDQAQANEALLHLASFQTKLRRAEAKKAEAQSLAESEFSREAEPLRRQIGEIEDQLEKWYRKNRKKFEADGAKSVALDAGTIGIRKAAAAIEFLWKPEEVVAAIKRKWKGSASMLSALIKTEEKPMKSAIKKLVTKPRDLEHLGCKLNEDENFFVELKPEILAKISKAA